MCSSKLSSDQRREKKRSTKVFSHAQGGEALNLLPLIREVRRERILDNRNKALKVQEKQAAMMEKVVLVMIMMMMIMMTVVMMMRRIIMQAAMMEKVVLMTMMMISLSLQQYRNIIKVIFLSTGAGGSSTRGSG